MFHRVKQLMRVFAAIAPSMPPPPVRISEDLEVAEFRLLASGNRDWPVHVSVEALASAAETQVRSPEQAEALVRDHMHWLERAASKALARGDVVDGVVLIRPQDLAP